MSGYTEAEYKKEVLVTTTSANESGTSTSEDASARIDIEDSDQNNRTAPIVIPSTMNSDKSESHIRSDRNGAESGVESVAASLSKGYDVIDTLEIDEVTGRMRSASNQSTGPPLLPGVASLGSTDALNSGVGTSVPNPRTGMCPRIHLFFLSVVTLLR